MPITKQEWSAVLKSWAVLSKVVSTLHTEDQYENAVKWLDQLIDEVSLKPNPEFESLIETLGTLIQDYEDRMVPETESSPAGALKFLMEEHHLKQSDLKEIGSQGVISEIFSGKSQLNIRQIKALSKRFNVPPSVFI